MPTEQQGPHSANAQPSLPGRFSLGIAVFAFVGAAFVIMLAYTMEFAESLGYDMAPERLPGRPLAGMALVVSVFSWFASLGGFALGLACLALRKQRKPSAAWGTALNGLFFFGILIYLMLNWERGRLP